MLVDILKIFLKMHVSEDKTWPCRRDAKESRGIQVPNPNVNLGYGELRMMSEQYLS